MPVLKIATGKKTLLKASSQITGRPSKYKMNKASPLNRMLRGKVKPRGKTILLPNMRPCEKLATIATITKANVKIPNGAADIKSRLKPPIAAQPNPSSRSLKIVQAITNTKTKSGWTPLIWISGKMVV